MELGKLTLGSRLQSNSNPGCVKISMADFTCAQIGAVDKPYPIFKLRDKIEEKTGWDGYADTDRR